MALFCIIFVEQVEFGVYFIITKAWAEKAEKVEEMPTELKTNDGQVKQEWDGVFKVGNVL